MSTPEKPRSFAPRTDLPAPAGGMNLAKRPTGVILALVVFFVVFFAMGIPSAAWTLISGAPLQAQPGGFSRVQGLVSLFSFGASLLLLWLWIRVKERRSFSTLGFDGGASGLRLALQGFGLGAAMIAVCVLVPVAAGQARLEWASPDATGLLFIAAMLLGFLVQGSTEEILNRGYLTQAVARRWGLVAAVVVQTVAFTLLHGMNAGIGVMPIINLAVFAVFASLMSLAQGSLWGVCALHGVWNWAQGAVFGVAVSGQEVGDTLFAYQAQPGSIDLLTGGVFGIEGSLVTTVVYAIGAVIAWRAFRRKLASQRA